jgi:hypothetical protein
LFFTGLFFAALCLTLFFTTRFRLLPKAFLTATGVDAAARFFADRAFELWRVVERPAAVGLLVGFAWVVLRRPFRLAMFSPFGTLTFNDKCRTLCCLSEISDPVQRSGTSRNRLGILPTEIAGCRTPLSNTGIDPSAHGTVLSRSKDGTLAIEGRHPLGRLKVVLSEVEGQEEIRKA